MYPAQCKRQTEHREMKDFHLPLSVHVFQGKPSFWWDLSQVLNQGLTNRKTRKPGVARTYLNQTFRKVKHPDQG